MKRQKNKKNAKEERTSFTELHSLKMEAFENMVKTQLPLKRKQLEKLKLKNTDQNTISKLEKEIRKLESQDDMTEYLLNIHDVLKRKSVLDDHENTSTQKKTKNVNNLPSSSIDSFCVREKSNHKTSLLNDYLYHTTGCVANNFEKSQVYKQDDFVCTDCSSSNMIVESAKSSMICLDCGLSRDWQDPNLPQWSNETNLTKQYRYKRPTYFIDHLNRMQAKENVILPKELMQEIMKELHKRRITNSNDITEKLIKNILRSIGKSEYYDNIHTIILKLSGKTPTRLTPELEHTLISMFQKTLEPFEKHKHLIKGRTNYLSYPYVIRKLLHIIADNENHAELKQFGRSCSLLKSHEKLRDQEKVWERICKDLNWPFHKSI